MSQAKQYLCPIIGHDWTEVRRTAEGVVVEERCAKCGAVRRRFDAASEWQPATRRRP